MNIYIYDDYLNKPKYSRILNRVEIRLTDLNLNGKIIRLGTIRNVSDVIQNEIKNGAKTIVAVGNNQTVSKVIGAIIDNELYGFFQKNILFSIIPIGEDNSIAESLGIKAGEEACNILLARHIKKIDIGIINNYYFLNKVSLPSAGAVLEFKDNFSLSTNQKGIIEIFNLRSATGDDKNLKVNPVDGLLDVYIKTGKGVKDLTRLSTDNLKISAAGAELVVDGALSLPAPANISIVRGKLNVVVGRDRSFD
ncbi:MAG: diacylglycerol/lipid kinase family protein [Patescibacteria group bacterium]|jgi:diacylglycerol kinase family enzyme